MSNSVEQELEKFEVPTRTRFGWVTRTISVLCVLLSLAHIWFNTLSTWSEL